MTTPALALICPNHVLQGSADKAEAERVGAASMQLQNGEGAAA